MFTESFLSTSCCAKLSPGPISWDPYDTFVCSHPHIKSEGRKLGVGHVTREGFCRKWWALVLNTRCLQSRIHELFEPLRYVPGTTLNPVEAERDGRSALSHVDLGSVGLLCQCLTVRLGCFL